ncbi:MAG: DUF917 domain-containing protein [Fastidiosipila sp.]|jgi:hypothetical protein|nr:DUF917 domain-containing protein [Fastidiosipila sp.]
MEKKHTLTNRQEVEDFVLGCTFYGTGGGGDYAEGVDALMKQLSKGNEIGWVDVDSVNDDEYSCCPFLMGSIAPETPEVTQDRKDTYRLGDRISDNTQAMVGAVKVLEEIQNQGVSVLVPIELGGGNTAACVAAAAEMGISVVDGDYTGRAIPEIQQTTPYIFEQELLPIASFDGWNNVATIREAANWRMAERIGKMIAEGGYSKCAQAGFFASAPDMKKSVIRNTLTECYNVGKALREARELGEDPALAAINVVGGWVVHKGKLTKKESKNERGYYWGIHTLEGVDEFDGQEFKIWFKNENHVSWLNGEAFVTSPDMIQVIDTKTGQPYTNNKIELGMELTVIAMPAREIFRSERGMDILGPRAFGFDIDYKTVESLIK